MSDATQAQLRSIHDGQDDVDALHTLELLEQGSWAVPQAGTALPALERLPHAEGQEAHQDVPEHPLFTMVPDRPDRQIALVDSKGRLGLPELDVGLPQLFVAPVVDVRAQDRSEERRVGKECRL